MSRISIRVIAIVSVKYLGSDLPTSIFFFFFKEGRNALCTFKEAWHPASVWDSAAHAALPTKTPSLF